MKHHAPSRRDFLHSAVITAAGCCVDRAAGRPPNAILTRPNVSSFTQSSQNMLSYASAVKEMLFQMKDYPV